jgi:hypothetical protein
MRDVATPILEDLFRATGHEVRFGILDGEVLKYIYKSAIDVPVSEFSAAATLPLHATALGKVLLAFTEPEFVELILARDLRAFTTNTIVDRERIRWMLKLVRKHRIAASDRELREDYSAIAAPIFGSTGRVVAALVRSSVRRLLSLPLACRVICTAAVVAPNRWWPNPSIALTTPPCTRTRCVAAVPRGCWRAAGRSDRCTRGRRSGAICSGRSPAGSTTTLRDRAVEAAQVPFRTVC